MTENKDTHPRPSHTVEPADDNTLPPVAGPADPADPPTMDLTPVFEEALAALNMSADEALALTRETYEQALPGTPGTQEA